MYLLERAEKEPAAVRCDNGSWEFLCPVFSVKQEVRSIR